MRKPYIVCAANRFPDGTILCGARHWDAAMRSQADAAGIRGGKEEQGFIDQFGKFYSREEALQTMKETGQKVDWCRNGSTDCLFSEGLY